jgi:hypothetical protein
MTGSQFSHSKKFKIVANTTFRLANGKSLRSSACSYNLQGVQICKWKAKAVQLSQTKQCKKSLSQGAKWGLGVYENKIML